MQTLLLLLFVAGAFPLLLLLLFMEGLGKHPRPPLSSLFLTDSHPLLLLLVEIRVPPLLKSLLLLLLLVPDSALFPVVAAFKFPVVDDVYKP